MQPLWHLVRPQLCYIATFSFCINLLFLIPAIFMMQVFDRVLTSNSQETLLVLLAGTGIALFLLLLLDYVRTRLQHILGNIIDEKLSSPVVHATVTRVGSTPQRVSMEGVRDVASLRTVFSANGLVAVFDTPWIFIYVLVIWSFHPSLGMGAAAAALFMLALAWTNNRVTHGALEALQKDSRRVTQYVESSLRNAEVLQALGMTERLIDRWRTLKDRVAAMQADTSRASAAFATLTRTSRQAIQVLMLALGAYLVLTQEASAGIMVATTILLGRAVQPVEQLVQNWRSLVDARAAYRRLNALSLRFDEEEQRLALPRPEGRLSVAGASFRAPHSDRWILFNVGFELARGEALAVIGPSASGKSTLARLLTGVWTATSGTVRLDNANVATWPHKELGLWMGYVPQDVELFDGSVAENIARLGPVDSAAVVEAAKRAHAHDMILSLAQGYDTPVGEQGANLSPGQRQRVALARALFGDVQFVVLDEPNSNLDSAGEIALAEALSDLRTAGVTSVVITHRPSLVAHVDKILVLDRGQVQQFGLAADVMKAMQRQARAVVNGRAA